MVFVFAICGAVVAGFLLVGRSQELPDPRPLRLPVLTGAALLVIGTVSTLQLTAFPQLEGWLGRDRSKIADGQLWRLVTAVTVQDGGTAGTVVNLVALALIGAVAEQVLRRRWWLAAFALPALAGELAGLAWQPVGAGNSVGVAGLCATTAVVVLGSGRSLPWIPAVVSLLAFAVLALQQDLHGAAGMAGLLVGLSRVALEARAGRRGRSRKPGPRPAPRPTDASASARRLPSRRGPAR